MSLKRIKKISANGIKKRYLCKFKAYSYFYMYGNRKCITLVHQSLNVQNNVNKHIYKFDIITMPMSNYFSDAYLLVHKS